MADHTEEILNVVRDLHARFPTMRFGQLVVNIATWAKGPGISAAWDVEDREFLDAARKNLASMGTLAASRTASDAKSRKARPRRQP